MNSKTVIGGILAAILAVSGSILLVSAISDSENAICSDNGFAHEYDPDKGACRPTGNYSKSITMAVGNTANSPAPSIEKDSDLYRYIKNSIAGGAKIKMISAATDLSVMPISYEITNQTNDANGFVEAVDSAMNSIIEQLRTPATSDGATYYEAIVKAGRDAISSAKSNSTKGYQLDNVDGATVIVLGSGLSDGGLFNFSRDGLLYKNPSEIIDEMQKAGQLAESLSGLTIRWQGIGQTIEPQIPLPTKEQENLKAIYDSVFKAKGVQEVVFYDTALSNTALDNTHEVVPTPIENVIIFSDKELEFIGNTDQFKDESAARTTLRQVVKKLNQDHQQKS